MSGELPLQLVSAPFALLRLPQSTSVGARIISPFSGIVTPTTLDENHTQQRKMPTRRVKAAALSTTASDDGDPTIRLSI